MTKIESDIQKILLSQQRFEGDLKSHIDSSVTMDDVEKEVTGQVETAVLNCKLEQKTSTKKLTMRDAVFILGIIGVVAQRFV